MIDCVRHSQKDFKLLLAKCLCIQSYSDFYQLFKNKKKKRMKIMLHFMIMHYFVWSVT